MSRSKSQFCRWVWTLCLAMVAAIACTPAAFAQQVMLNTPGATATYDMQTGTVTWAVPTRLASNGVIYTADGQLAVTRGNAAQPPVRVIDATTGAFADVGLAFDARVAHPRDVAVYGLTDGVPPGAKGNPARLDAGGITRYPGCAPGTARAIDLSGDGTRLFAGCESGDLAVIDTVSGALLHTLTPGAVTFKSTYDGTALVVVAPAFDAPIDLIDANTGALLQRVPRPGTACTPALTRVSPDRTLGVLSCLRLVPNVPQVSATLVTMSPVALGLGRTLSDFTIDIDSISPDNRTMYSTAFPSIGPGSVVLTDLSTGVATRVLDNFFGSIAVNHPPLPPLPTAQISGRRVDFTWTQPPGSPLPTAYVLEIGTARGLSDLGIVELGPGLTLTVSGVPPGSYCVRVRARNTAGVSQVSSEMFIDVS